MSILNLLIKKHSTSLLRGVVDYGSHKKDGSHDHRHNRSEDRTPAQKAGDQKPGKSKAD